MIETTIGGDVVNVEIASTVVLSSGGLVGSVNGKIGAVVLNQDDVLDGTTYKQYSQTEKAKLASINMATKIDLNGNNSAITYENFIPSASPTYQEGRVWYDTNTRALSYYDNYTGTSIQTGKELIVDVRNNSGVNILNGQVVYVSGAVGQLPTIALAKADSLATSQIIGVATHDINNNANGKVTFIGAVNDFNTSAFTDGQAVYLSATTAGALTATPPASPNNVVFIGYITNANPSQGRLIVMSNRAVTNNNTLGASQLAPATENAVKTYVDTGLAGKQNTIANSDSITQGATNLFLTNAERTKLGNIPAGATGEIQFNEAGVLSSSSDLKYNTATQTLSVSKFSSALSQDLSFTTLSGTMSFVSPYATFVNFSSAQSGQLVVFNLITAEGKQAGFVHFDVASGNGRLFSVFSQPGVLMTFSPSNNEMLRLNGFGVREATSTANWIITTPTAGSVPLKIKGAASQSSAVQEWLNSSDVVKATITKDYFLHLNAPSVANRDAEQQFSLYDVATQRAYINHDTSASRLRLIAPNTTTLVSIDVSNGGATLASTGNLNLVAGAGGQFQFSVAGSNVFEFVMTAATAYIRGGTDTVRLLIQGVTLQSANLTEWQNSSGTVLTSINANGVIKSPQISTSLQVLTPTGTTQTIDWNSGSVIDLNLGSATGTVVLTFSNAQPATSYLIKVNQGATPRDLTFPAGTLQAGGGGATYTGTANQKDIIAVLYDGTNYFINVSKNYS